MDDTEIQSALDTIKGTKTSKAKNTEENKKDEHKKIEVEPMCFFS